MEGTGTEQQIKLLVAEVEKLTKALNTLTDMVQKIGEQNFQLKEVVVALADGQKEYREEVSEAMGNIVESTWFWKSSLFCI